MTTFRTPYPDYDVLEKWNTPSWNPQTRDVVEATHHDAAFLLLLEERRRFVDDVVALVTELTRLYGEHREHQVADRGVERVVVELGHGTYRATCASKSPMALITRSTARPAAPTQAGTPMPSR